MAAWIFLRLNGERNDETRNTPRHFASRWGFILASVGSAVGMANVWGFPNKMGSNGGGAFLLIYLLFVFIFSYVGLPAEFAMGRRAGTGTLGAYENAWATRGKTMPARSAVCWAGCPWPAPCASPSATPSSSPTCSRRWWIPCWARS